MTDRIRIITHEAVPKCGSYEVRFSDGPPEQILLLGRSCRKKKAGAWLFAGPARGRNKGDRNGLHDRSAVRRNNIAMILRASIFRLRRKHPKGRCVAS